MKAQKKTQTNNLINIIISDLSKPPIFRGWHFSHCDVILKYLYVIMIRKYHYVIMIIKYHYVIVIKKYHCVIGAAHLKKIKNYLYVIIYGL